MKTYKVKEMIETAALTHITPTMSNGEQVHIAICKSLVAAQHKYNVPMGVLLYIGIGGNAHKTTEFNKGYTTTINFDRLNKVLTFAEIFATRFGAKLRNNSIVIHFICRLVDKGMKIGEFRNIIKVVPKGTKFNNIKSAKQLSDMFLKGNNDIELSESGYYNGRKPTFSYVED